MTVFTRTRHLEEAIRSFLAQTYRDFELIVSDDGPTDEARIICDQFALDGRVRYRRNPRTLGAPLNVKAAMREARGDFVTVVNDDDAAEPRMLEILMFPLDKHPECSLCFADHWIMDSNSQVHEGASATNSRNWGRGKLKEGFVTEPLRASLRGSIPFVMGTLFRRDLYNPEWLQPEVEGAYDQWMSLCFALLGCPFFYVQQRVFRYRAHGASETARHAPEKARCQVFIFRSLLNREIPRQQLKFVKRTLGRFLFILGRDRLYFGSVQSAREAFLEAARHGFVWKAVPGIAATFLPAKAIRLIVTGWRHVRGIRAALPGG